MNQFSIVSNCPLCEEHSLHVIGEGEEETMQCIACGYATGHKFRGFKDDTNEAYKALTPEMKKWSKYADGRIWIPSVMSLPFGMLYPVNVKEKLKWAFAPMVEISEEEKENFPNEQGGFYERKIDTDNAILYDLFIEGMTKVNELLKQKASDGE